MYAIIVRKDLKRQDLTTFLKSAKIQVWNSKEVKSVKIVLGIIIAYVVFVFAVATATSMNDTVENNRNWFKMFRVIWSFIEMIVLFLCVYEGVSWQKLSLVIVYGWAIRSHLAFLSGMWNKNPIPWFLLRGSSPTDKATDF